jgi:hypothetical protein
METTYAYLAGAIDIDGFIAIDRRLGRQQMQYHARIGLSDASPVLPNLLHALFPGRLHEIRPKKSSYATAYLWEATHQQAREPLLRLMPHLRLKRRHAELALALMDLIEHQNAGRSTSKPLAEEEDATRRRLYEEVARLNSGRRRRKHRVEAPLASLNESRENTSTD